MPRSSIDPEALPASFIGQDQSGARSLVVTRRGARWVIPVDSRRVAAAALQVYRPKSFAETLAWQGARRLAFPWILGCRLRDDVGLRRDLASAVCARLGRPDLRFAVAIPQTDRATVAAVVPSGTVVAFGKLAGSKAATARVEREHAALCMVRPQLPPSVHAPEVLFRGRLHGIEALLISPVVGRQWSNPGRLWPGYVRALASLVRQDVVKPFGTLVPAAPPLDGEWSFLLPAAADRLASWRETSVRTALVHGDFTPWNVALHAAGAAVYDWEDALEEGPPFWDLWHFAVQSAALLHRWSSGDLVAAAVGLHGPVGRALRAYGRAARLSDALAAPVLAAYLAASVTVVGGHGDLTRPDRVRGLDFRARLLAALLEAWR